MALSDYLAKNYLTADPGTGKQSKKRKRKEPKSVSGLQIADDDDGSWQTVGKNGHEEHAATLGKLV